MEILDAVKELESSKKNVRFDRLRTICENFFGSPRINGSHYFFRTPWLGDPRINLQKSRGGEAKPYQVSQVLRALRKLEKKIE